MSDEEKKSKKELELEKLREIRKNDDKLLKSSLILNEVDVESEIYFELDSFIDMAIDGISIGTIAQGAGGVGKTFRVLNKLSKSNVTYAYLESFTTSQGLFIWLYKNRDKDILVLDDVVGLTNDKSLSFLKSLLWSMKGKKRTIMNNSSKPIKDEEGDIVPNVFETDARVIIITNQLNHKNPNVAAVISRVNFCKIDIPREEVLRIMEQVARKDFDGLSINERLEVFEFLKKNTTDSSENLNLRTLIKSFQYKMFSNKQKNKELWKKILLKVLKQDTDVLIVEELVKDNSFESEESRAEKFEEITGKSRATYFNKKKRLGMVV